MDRAEGIDGHGVRLGVVARADDRGIGVMTYDFAQNMAPDRVLVIREPGAEAQGFPPHLDRYPGAAVVTYDGGLPEPELRAFLDGLDVCYCVETLYDQRMAGWAADAGCSLVLHVMPEFFPAQDRSEVAALWAPTTWRLDSLPAHTRLVSVPVSPRPLGAQQEATEAPLRVVHVVGHRAAQDRAGTSAVLVAAKMLREPTALRIVTQDKRLHSLRGLRPGVTCELILGGVVDRWDLYRDADVLVMPRKFGGLSLPVQEAMASGLAVVMTDVEPQRSFWPVVTVATRERGVLRTAAGDLPLAIASPAHLASTLDELNRHRDALHAHQARSLAWAQAHTWEALLPLYRAELERAAS